MFVWHISDVLRMTILDSHAPPPLISSFIISLIVRTVFWALERGLVPGQSAVSQTRRSGEFEDHHTDTWRAAADMACISRPALFGPLRPTAASACSTAWLQNNYYCKTKWNLFIVQTQVNDTILQKSWQVIWRQLALYCNCEGIRHHQWEWNDIVTLWQWSWLIFSSSHWTSVVPRDQLMMISAPASLTPGGSPVDPRTWPPLRDQPPDHQTVINLKTCPEMNRTRWDLPGRDSCQSSSKTPAKVGQKFRVEQLIVV